MPRPIHYQSQYDSTAQRLYATVVDREYLQARLDSIGGSNAALLEHSSDENGAKYTLRQGVSKSYLPEIVQKVLNGDLIIERTETWHKADDGRYEGNVTARVKGAPGTIGGALAISGDGESSELDIDGEAKVDVPIVGGKVESVVAEQVVKLMKREAEFTKEWLAEHK
jgi:hypothetical protein